MPATTYAIIGIVLLIMEMAVPGFVLLPIGVGFLITALIAVYVVQIEFQLIALAVLAPACFLVAKKFFKQHDRPKVPTNFEGLIGKQGVVEDDIPAGERGYVRVYGDSWKVEGHKHETLHKGTKIIVDHVEGTKVFVRKA